MTCTIVRLTLFEELSPRMPRPAAVLRRLRPLPTSPAGVLAAAVSLALLLPLSAAPASADNGPEPGAPAVTTEAELAQTAEQVAEAERKHAEMNALVERTAAVLEEGTARLEAGQAELARTQAEQALAQRSADEALARAAQAQASLGVVVSASYRSPLPRSVQMALTAGPDDIVDAIVARADLDRVQGSSQDVLREATAARVQADAAVERAAQLAASALAQEKALAGEVDALRQIALDSEQTLTAAAAALTAARTDHQGALDAAAASAAARDAEAAALAAAGSYLVATCGGTPVQGQANGLLDPSSLCPLDDAPGEALRADAAAAFNALNAAHKAERGTPLCVTDSYRTYSEQVALYASKPALAAVPGRSNHGWGVAVDFGCGVNQFGSEAHEWMRARAVAFGWFHPTWAQAGGSRPEAWHWEFAGP